MSSRDDPPAGAREIHELIPAVYTELRALAAAYLRGERAGHTLQPTALANEVYVKFARSERRLFENKSQFMAAAAQAIRRILIDHARLRAREKRGGGLMRLDVAEVRLGKDDPGVALVDFDDAVTELQRLNPRVGHVVELRVYGELTVAQIADVIGVAASTVSEDWVTAKAWLKRRLISNATRGGSAPHRPRTAAA
jgi:RNA polymerase sigma factor (TIGR02999 family)